MLKWCAYCQEFPGEVPPFDTLASTHGICQDCVPHAEQMTSRELEHALALKSVKDALSEAGSAGDVDAAAHVIDEAVAAHIRAVDVLLGVVAPLLYTTGEHWKQAIISVAEEHRFTEFCERVFETVEARVDADERARAEGPGRIDALVVNAIGNRHTLGQRVLTLWLSAKGLRARVLDAGLGLEGQVAAITALRPRMLLVSMALAEHRSGVIALLERLATHPENGAIRVVVGGDCVKRGMVEHIPGAELVADIHQVSEELLG